MKTKTTPEFNIVFEKLPRAESKSGRPAAKTGVWNERLKRMRRTKTWARVYGPISPLAASQIARNIRLGAYAGIKPNEFDAKSRRLENGTYVYVRHMGKDKK